MDILAHVNRLLLTLIIKEFLSLLKAAQIRENEQILIHITAQDTIAKEIKYHRSCYKEFTKPDTLAKLHDQTCEREDSRNQAYHESFHSIQMAVQSEIIENNKIVSIADLASQFSEVYKYLITDTPR